MEFTRDPEDAESEEDNFKTNIFKTSISGLLQFLPNSRTSIGLDITGSYQHSLGERTVMMLVPEDYQLKNRQFSIVSTFDIYYYISPRFRVQVISSLSGYNSLTKQKYESALPEVIDLMKIFRHNFLLTLIYSFF